MPRTMTFPTTELTDVTGVMINFKQKKEYTYIPYDEKSYPREMNIFVYSDI